MDRVYLAASYSRLSKDDNTNDESSSISSQKAIINSFAKLNGFNIVKEYVDDGYSGGNFDRPAFREMIEDIEKGIINCVITKDLSRLGREIYRTGDYIEKYFTSKGVRYIAINDSYDSNIGDLMLGLRLGVNDLYLRDISKKVKSSFRNKQERGEYIGSIPCYGYLKDPNDKHKLIPDKSVVHIIKHIYDLALQGYSTRAIAEKLTDEMIPIPIVHKKDPRASKVTDNGGLGIWKYATIKSILTSQMYIGNMVQNTYNKISYNSKKLRKVKEEEYIIVENTHEPIIDKETFFKVQELLNSRTKITVKNTERYLLSGLLKCKECGHNINISEKKTKSGNTHHTQCNLFLRKGKYGGCSSHRLKYEWIEEDILDYLKKIGESFIEYYDQSNIMNSLSEYYHKNVEKLEDKIKEIDKELKENMKVIENLYIDKVNNNITLEIYKMLSSKIEEKIAILIKEKNKILSKINFFKEELNNDEFKKCKRDIEQILSLSKPPRDLLNRLIEKIEINKNKEIDVYFKFKKLNFLNGQLE